jgi:hypothetical protein
VQQLHKALEQAQERLLACAKSAAEKGLLIERLRIKVSPQEEAPQRAK